MTLRTVDFEYWHGGVAFEVSSLFKIEGGQRELIHHELPDELIVLRGVSLATIDRLADEAADKEGIIA